LKKKNKTKKFRRRYIHKELDDALKKVSKRDKISEMELMKMLGIKLKKGKKKEWSFNFRV